MDPKSNEGASVQPMSEQSVAATLHLNHPWLVAVWPGMGSVALNAGVYLLAKLNMTAIAEMDAGDLFDIDQVEVKQGIIQPAKRPRNRFFLWTDPEKKRDLVIFLGEAQPPIGKYPFCRQLLNFARNAKVEKVITFAAMATQMELEERSRVFGAATDNAGLEQLKQLELVVLEEGNIGGLNGVLLGAAAEFGLPGICLLGEMPHIFSQLPFPKASLAILEVFAAVTGINIDFAELAEQAQATESQLGDLLARVQQSYGEQAAPEEESFSPEAPEEKKVPVEVTRRIETLFDEALRDRSKAFELKRTLDRAGLFKEYEDRFLDLFKKAS